MDLPTSQSCQRLDEISPPQPPYVSGLLRFCLLSGLVSVVVVVVVLVVVFVFCHPLKPSIPNCSSRAFIYDDDDRPRKLCHSLLPKALRCLELIVLRGNLQETCMLPIAVSVVSGVELDEPVKSHNQ